MMDAISLTRLQAINPIVAYRITGLEAEVEQTMGISLRVTRALATAQEQTAYYSQGRFPLVVVNLRRKAVKLAPITAEQNVRVTDAPPYHTWHEYGLAGDVVPMDPLPDWNEEHPVWEKIVELAPKYKLVDGIHWHDEPHLQPVEVPVSPTPLYVSTLMGQTVQACWKMAGLVEEETT